MLKLVLAALVASVALKTAVAVPTCDFTVMNAINAADESICFAYIDSSEPTWSSTELTRFCESPYCRRYRIQLQTAVKTDCMLRGIGVVELLSSTDELCGAVVDPPTSAPVSVTPSVRTTSPPIEPPKNAVTIVLAVVGGIVVVGLVIIIVCLVRRKRRPSKLDRPTTATDAYVDISQAGTAELTQTTTGDFPEGRLLLQYQISLQNVKLGVVISQGGFGEVMRGSYNHQIVAVKRLLPSRRNDPHSIRGFVKEIQLNATLQHTCLVKFIGAAWDVPANLCMITEFIHGGDLRHLLVRYTTQGHPNGHDNAKLRIAHHVAQALTYLHSQNPPVVHRDLKSRNVLLTDSLDAKVIDFGVSTERQDVTMTAGVGTSLWMAPEVMKGDRYDEKADVFSFGVILSELDTHEIPYDHARDPVSNRKMADMVLMQKVTEGKLKPRFTDVADSQIVALARDCLEVDPTKRPSASVVVACLEARQRNGPYQSSHPRTANDYNSMMLDTHPTTKYAPRR